MNDAVEKAIEEIRSAFPRNSVDAQDDSKEGAWVIIEDVPVGDIYTPSTTWVGFRITFQYPYADVYPHFVRSDLTRVDRRPVGDGFSAGQTFLGRPALQISRKSNRLNPKTDTALLKLMKVLQWLKNHP